MDQLAKQGQDTGQVITVETKGFDRVQKRRVLASNDISNGTILVDQRETNQRQ